jgi:hypothetical protein
MIDRFRFHNHNPDNAIEEDCVCRAISMATGLKYKAVNNLLALSADYNHCDRLCLCCYRHLLEDVLLYNGYDCDFERTVYDVVERHSDKKLLIRIDGHLTCSIYGTIVDIWDCSDELVDCFWIV